MGTDAGTPFNKHGENLNEIIFMTEAGFTNEEAIIAATDTASRVLGLENEIGTIKEGKIADLLIFKGDPLNDINLFKDPDNLLFVARNGRVFKNRAND